MATPEPSEWGKINAGQAYGILAIDVDRALSNAALSQHEQSLLQHIREESWGTSARRKQRGQPWPDPIPVRVGFKALARLLGVPMQRLYEARSRLLKSKILVAEGPFLSINKNAHEWVWPDSRSPRLTPEKLSYAAFARSRKAPPAFTVERECDSRSNVNGFHGQTLTAFTVERECDSRSNVNGHIEGTRVRSEERFKKTSEERETAGGVSLGEDFESGEGEPDPIASTPQRAPEDLDAIREAARILAGDIRTQHLGQRLLAESNTPGLVALDGWRFVRAANLLLGPQFNDAQRRRGFPLLCGIARNLDESERDAPAQRGRRSKNPVLTPEERERQRALFYAQLSEGKR